MSSRKEGRKVSVTGKNISKGELFLGRPRNISWERLWAFSGGPFTGSGWPRKNIHTDPDFARNCGLPSVAASATQFQGYVVELMIDLFGLEWLSKGTMDVKFINIVDAGDTLVSKAEVTSREAIAGGSRFVLDVCCENQKSGKVLVGSATGVISKADLPDEQPEAPSLDTEQGDITASLALKPLEFVVTPELNQQCLYAVEDFHRWYIEETEFGPPVAHPALLLNMSNATRSPSYHQPQGRAGFHARDQTFFYNPARLGKELRVTWNRLGDYEKRGRPYSLTDILMVDQDGLQVLRRLSHSTIASKEYKKDYTK